MIAAIKRWIYAWLESGLISDPCAHVWGKWHPQIWTQSRRCVKCGVQERKDIK